MSFFRILFLLFLSIPVLEIYLLIKVGDLIGALPTIALVVFTAVVGVWLLRRQGFATLAKAQQSMARGEVPATALFEGMMLFVAGALLLTPGFFTDTLGFILLIPFARQRIIAAIVKNGVVGTYQSKKYQSTSHTYESSSTEVIEGEFISHDDKK